MIPFLDLHSINKPYQNALKQHYDKVIDSGYYVLGKQVSLFENEYASYCGSKYCIGVASGLDALTLILKAYIESGELNANDEVIVASNSYIATILSVLQADLKPVFVEPDNTSFNLDPQNVKNAITSKTGAILATHLYGQLCDMSSLQKIAQENAIVLIDDCAQSHGARDTNGVISGNLCDASAHSFYPTKNLGALGDAGAITTNNKALADLLKKLRNYGFSERYVAQYRGYNSRLDELQASFLRVKLKHLDNDNTKRKTCALYYLKTIKNTKVIMPSFPNENAHVFHLFVIKVKDRDAFIAHLKKHNIGYGIHYPVPPHKQDALHQFKHLNLPISSQLHNEVVSLPCHPRLSEDDIARVADVVNTY